MIFVDEARIFVKAGDGGKGCESFYSDMRTRYPRPNGGNGGEGGDVIFVADQKIQTLMDFRFKQHYQAQRGGHGGSKGKTGKTGADCLLRVPVGTVLYEDTRSLLIKDLITDGQEIVVAKGGRGGQGNARRKTVRPPREGEERRLRLELKIIADVGIVGFPNAGKSTLISNISRVKSKIASYPFTTKQPILGIVEGQERRFVVADLPGLIEGAHQGRGLGHRFLRHAERTKILLHVIDMGSSEGRNPLEDFEKINHELQQYSEELFFKHKIIAANKMDLPAAEENLKKFKKKYKEKVFAISALQKEGLNKLVEAIESVLCRENSLAKSGALSSR